jgi:hypothetical protein
VRPIRVIRAIRGLDFGCGYAALLTISMLCLASSIFAQDIDLGLGGDASSLLNIPAPGGNRGTPPRGTTANVPPVDRLVRLRELLASANAPLSKDQETGLNALLNAEIPAMRQTLQARILQLQGARGGAAPHNANLPSMDELAPEIIRLNDQLLGRMANAPGLNTEQQGLIKKLYKDQVKSRGGFDAIKLTMEDAGAPFSPEQIAQIQPLFDEQNRARAQLVKSSEGQPPDKGKLDQLQRDTLGRVLKLLTPAQRTALLASSKP